jgi:hypothetical protein
VRRRSEAAGSGWLAMGRGTFLEILGSSRRAIRFAVFSATNGRHDPTNRIRESNDVGWRRRQTRTKNLMAIGAIGGALPAYLIVKGFTRFVG